MVSSASRLALALGLLVVATNAYANASMGMAFETFEYRAWAIYVIATVALEAIVIGRALRTSWGKSLLFSALANALTALFGVAFCSELLAPGLHSMVDNPNPFLRTTFTLILLGALSAWIEAALWAAFTRTPKEDRAHVTRASFIAHAWGLPLALLILLTPPHPYTGIDATTNVWRRIHHMGNLKQAWTEARVRAYDKGSDNVQPFNSLQELLSACKECRTYAGDGFVAETYYANYSRFDVREEGRYPIESKINPRFFKHQDSEEWVLYVRYPPPYNYMVLWVNGEVRRGDEQPK